MIKYLDFYYVLSTVIVIIHGSFPKKTKKASPLLIRFKNFKYISQTPNKMWVDKCNEFCKRSMKLWLKNNDIEIYSTHDEGKSVATKRFVRTLKNKIHKYLTSISKMFILVNLII